MKTRIITAVAALAVFVPVLFFADTIVFPLAFGLIAAISGCEMTRAAGLGKKLYLSIPAALYCFAAVAAARIREIFPKLLPDGIPHAFVFLALTGLFLLYLLCVCVFAFPGVSFGAASTAFTLCVFTAFSFYGIVKIQSLRPYDYLLIFIAAWMTDTFAIFGGKFFGKKKLSPGLSPKKTVAGVICGVVGAVLGFLVYNLVVKYGLGCRINFPLRLALAVPASLTAQLGDLAASAVKRDRGIKDFGRILPGHGGVADRFDSVMFLSGAAFLLMSAAKYFKAV